MHLHERLAAAVKKWRDAGYPTDSHQSVAEIRELAVFGSILKPSEFRPDSDVDFLVTFAPEDGWSLFDHMQIDHRCIKVFMSHEFLYRPDVRAAHKQVSGKGVAERMAGGMLMDAGLLYRGPDRLLRAGSKPSAADNKASSRMSQASLTARSSSCTGTSAEPDPGSTILLTRDRQCCR